MLLKTVNFNKMSIPATYNWNNDTRGDTIPSKTFKPITVDGVDVDLTDVDIRMHVRSSGGSLLAEFTKGNGITLSDTNGFTVEPFKITRYEGKAFYDIEFTFPSGVVKTWIAGEILIVKDITY